MAERFSIPPFSNGIVREAAVDESTAPQNSVELAINITFDRIGAFMRRLGLTRLGTQLSAASFTFGMGLYRNNAGTIYQLLLKNGTTVKMWNGSTYTNVRTGLTLTSKARFANLVDYIFMVNGHANEVCSSYAGTGSFGSTNVASLPKGDFIEVYRSRLWIADNSVDKVYYSDVVTTSNTITGGSAFIQISPNDGEKITALMAHPHALLVFKQNHVYRIFNINNTDPDPNIFRGTYSQESVIEAKDGIYYHHPTGFYKFVFDGDQEEISRPIIDIVKAIPRAKYDTIAGWADDDHVYWSIGDITLNGITYANMVVVRTISTKIWTLTTMPTEVYSSVLYDDGTTLLQVLGDDDGNVLELNVGNDDFGTPIFYDLITHWMYFTDQRQLNKSITKIAAMQENATGVVVQFQIDNDDQKKTTNKWKPFGEIKENIIDILSGNAKNFKRLRFRIAGNSSGTPFIFRNLEVVDLTTSAPQ